MALPAFTARYIASVGYSSGSQWSDQSGNGNHITSAGGGTWPSKVTAAGKTFLRFNGSTDRLAQASVTIAQQNGTIVIIGRNRSNNGDCVFGAGAWPGILLTVKTGEIPTVYFGGYNDCAELACDTFTIFGLRMSGSAIGIIYGAEETAGAAFAAGTKTGIAIGASDSTGTLTGTWDVCEVMVCAGRASDSELQSIRDYAVATYGCGGGTKDMALYLTGDSLFLGYNITPPTQDNDVLAGLEARYTAAGLSCPPVKFAPKSGWRIGTSGSTSSLYDDLTSDAAAWLTNKSGYTKNGVVCNACVNDALVDGLTAAQIYTRAAAYIAQAISLGATDVYMGTMSVSDGSSQETLRNTYNAALKANAHQAAGPRYFDIGADAYLGTYAERTNSTYFQLDMLHWTAAGDDRAAQILYDRLEPSGPPPGPSAPRYMWWAHGAGSYTVAGLPASLRNNGWVAHAEDVLIPRFLAFNDDDEAKCIMHMAFGRSREEFGDLPLDALLMRREEGEFPLVYDLDAFKEAMDLFFAECGQYPTMYVGTIHGTEYDKWHRLSPAAFRARVRRSLEFMLAIPQAHRRLIVDTMGVFGASLSKQSPDMFVGRWPEREAPRRATREATIQSRLASGIYKSGGISTRSRFGEVLEIARRELLCVGVGIEPRARLESGWENADDTVDWWTTSQLMGSSDNSEDGTGDGWCLSATRCNGTFGVLLTDAQSDGQIATWLQGTDDGVLKAVAVGGLSDPGVTSSDMAGYVSA